MAVPPLVRIQRELCRDVAKLTFGPPVTHVYNPLEYARGPAESYLQRWGSGHREVLLFGMNPGPFGMAQTGVPFGEVTLVRDWLGVDGPVGKPDPEHPKRPIDGFDCHRSEVSGARLWGWAKTRFHSPERFFARFFIVNYCPLVFLEESGRNRTPDKLPKAEAAPLFAACDHALRRVVAELEPKVVLGVGKFAYQRATLALGDLADGLRLGTILHPSPASPLANRGWAAEAERQLAALGVALPRPGRAAR